MNRTRLHLCAVASLVASFVTGHARADGADSARAEALYTEGKQRAASGDYVGACPLFEQSQRIEAAIGTQFNLADCYEHTGRRAAALALFREVVRIAQMSGRQERQRAAEERAAVLERLVARIRVNVTAPSTDETVRIDDVEVPADALARGQPVDPGEHEVRALAPGFAPWSQRVTVPAGSDAALVEVTAPRLETVTKEVVVEVREEPSILPAVGVGVAGVGVVGLAIGTVFGVTAMTKKHSAGCDGVDCSRAGEGAAAELRAAQSAGKASTIAFVAGGVLTAGGVAIFLFAPRTKTPSNAAASATALEVTAGGLRMRGSF